MVLFAGILTYHCMKQLKSYHWCQKLRLATTANNKRVKLWIFKRFNTRNESHEEGETEPFLRQDDRIPQVVSFNDYREILIED